MDWRARKIRRMDFDFHSFLFHKLQLIVKNTTRPCHSAFTKRGPGFYRWFCFLPFSPPLRLKNIPSSGKTPDFGSNWVSRQFRILMQLCCCSYLNMQIWVQKKECVQRLVTGFGHETIILEWCRIALRCEIIESYSKEFYKGNIFLRNFAFTAQSNLVRIKWRSAPASRLTSQPKINPTNNDPRHKKNILPENKNQFLMTKPARLWSTDERQAKTKIKHKKDSSR